ncbi:sensor histidine kinase [Streptomyces clavuligerus]|uniref:histidine kinase n=1 Tax=Streptomyces clavuligerus TaxID=1901 RepID=E2PX09_STRCL|nr:histidine kinase [Streptomyces clavuligerus]ANW17429.1 histidine kinase [Streptomyces clavuligerus]AXU11978.1 two-component sensor histidine kinase [Streptomyces clavuligerus]EFG10086.1 putative two-component system sensor kinase [Streptomyces clavuligerus]MBY6301824.1 two-component sensor histidine kinase [Streptomyces clavuligerus]QCS04758.1 two-component sensor histidine kinase [Streptomyces clavuligerus]
MTRTEYPWLLPSAMAGSPGTGPGGTGRAPGPGGRPRRTVRDWVVDTVLFLGASLLGLTALDTSTQLNEGSAIVLLDQLLGAAACCALWPRRRWPVQLVLALAVVSIVTPAAGGAYLVALFSVAVHRPFRPVALVGGVAVLSAALQPAVRPDPSLGYLGSVVTGLLLVLLMVGWGMLVRSSRQLVVVLRERAERAEEEAVLRAEQAQRLAREAIAREMHDVLAHRLTLLSVHAGALEFRPDAPPAEVARAAGVIRDSAHEALQDLRQIIGVLRAPGEGDSADRPQPTLATLDTLVAEGRAAGASVVLDNRIADPAAVPAATGRTVYRIAQEGLTNARKHAPGAEVTVVVRGGPGEGVTVLVDNPAPPGEVPAVPGSGQGLIGLTERATLAGGTLRHGRTGDGGFHVQAWLPWSA